MSPVRALVLTGYGINCEEEMAAGFRLAGAEASLVHLGELLRGEVRLDSFHILALPGGFSFGDDLGAGKMLGRCLSLHSIRKSNVETNGCEDASRRQGVSSISEGARRSSKFEWNVKTGTFLTFLQEFVARGGFVFGVCNGFQALVNLGLLPNTDGSGRQQVSFARNASDRFEDRWCECVVNPRARVPFLRGIERLRLPVRNGEGRVLIPEGPARRAVAEGALDCLHYCDAQGRPTSSHPENPSGSDLACAALVDATGRVFGMMPHPEAALSIYNDPSWPRLKREGRLPADEEGPGLAVFRGIVRHLAGEGR